MAARATRPSACHKVGFCVVDTEHYERLVDDRYQSGSGRLFD
jgi:hypothetical protein